MKEIKDCEKDCQKMEITRQRLNEIIDASIWEGYVLGLNTINDFIELSKSQGKELDEKILSDMIEALKKVIPTKK